MTPRCSPRLSTPIARLRSEHESAAHDLLVRNGTDDARWDQDHQAERWPRDTSQTVQYPKTDFGNKLREVARVIKSDIGLEVAEIDYGGWDTHQNQGAVNQRFQYATLVQNFAEGLEAPSRRTWATASTMSLILTMSDFRTHGGGERHRRHRSRLGQLHARHGRQSRHGEFRRNREARPFPLAWPGQKANSTRAAIFSTPPISATSSARSFPCTWAIRRSRPSCRATISSRSVFSRPKRRLCIRPRKG